MNVELGKKLCYKKAFEFDCKGCVMVSLLHVVI